MKRYINRGVVWGLLSIMIIMSVSESLFVEATNRTSDENEPVGVVIDENIESNRIDSLLDSKRQNIPEPDLQLENSPERKTRITNRAGEVPVNDWAGFKAAYNDPTTTKIVMTGNISNQGKSLVEQTLTDRRNSIEIDGGGYTLYMGQRNLAVNAPMPVGTEADFHIHDIVLEQYMLNVASGGVPEAEGSWSFIAGDGTDYTRTNKWRFRLGNIKTNDAPSSNKGVARVLRAYRSEITLYGTMDLVTRAENFYAGSVIMEDGIQYSGNVTHYNYSVIWYVENSSSPSGNTGVNKEFRIGKNANVKLTQTQTSGTSYPAVFDHYAKLTVGENSIWNVSMPGNAVRLQHQNASVLIKSGAVVNLTSTQPGLNVVSFAHDNQTFKVEPTASLFIIGNSTAPLIDMAREGFTGTGVRANVNGLFEVDSPKTYDFRNINNGLNSRVLNAAYLNTTNNNNFRILNSDIDIWKMGAPVLGPSTHTYNQVNSFNVLGSGTNEVVTSSDIGLQSTFKQAQYRRISGMNQIPSVEWTPVTDADLSYQARVKIGETPDNQFGPNGEVIWIPVYASLNQAEVTFIDTFTDAHIAYTDSEGFAKYTGTKFNEAGKQLTADATRGPWESDAPMNTTVIDVTPPAPASVDNPNKLSPISTTLSGTGEVGAEVTLTINTNPAPQLTTSVNSQGKWAVTLPQGLLHQNDVIQIFLRDHAGKAEGLTNPEAPSTNNEVGNINPSLNLSYRDAVFPAATKVTVNGVLTLSSVPDNVSFGTLSILEFTKNIGVDHTAIDSGLIVEDSRGERTEWSLTAEVVEEMTNADSVLIGSLRYFHQGSLLTLTSEPKVIYINEANNPQQIYNISDSWGLSENQEGLKFQAMGNLVPKTTGNYTGTIRWSLRDTIE